MDGVEASRQIFAPERAARRAKPVRVIVLTTFDLDDRAATAIRHGASGFLLKDTTPMMLRDAIRTVHSGNAVLAPQDLATFAGDEPIHGNGWPAAPPGGADPDRPARA
jgi:DNA-binding NarL/FixJ family response regulator